MKRHLALALVFAGLVINASVFAGEQEVSTSFVSKVTDKASTATTFVKDTVIGGAIEQVQAHPYVAGTTLAVATLVAMYKKCSWFRRLVGMETEEDVQNKYAAAFEL